MTLAALARDHLEALCVTIGERPVGSLGNRAAADHLAATFHDLGLLVRAQGFECLAWRDGGARLRVDGRPYPVSVSPYSLPCRVNGRLRPLGCYADLENADLTDSVAFLHGELAREPLTPKGFPFYQVREHQAIVTLLEAKRPLAVIAATRENPSAAGACSPFALFEDGDLALASVYLHADACDRLADADGAYVALEVDSERSASTGRNVIAEVGAASSPTVVVTAHLDTKPGTPGALDDASGLVVLMLLAARLRDRPPEVAVELVALNGEDHYANPGEIAYLRANGNAMGRVALAINVDGVGDRGSRVAFSRYGDTEDLAAALASAFDDDARFVPGAPWYQGDHALFVQHGRPALALTSERIEALMREVVHTPRDTLDLIDPAALAATAAALASLLHVLPGRLVEPSTDPARAG